MNLGEKIAKSKESWERKPSDFYATPADMTQALISAIGLEGPLADPLHILEPCCGEGHIARVLEANGHKVTARDLNHTGYGTPGMNYLTTPESDPNVYEFDAVITNPPFSFAEEFIWRALRDAPLVAMLLPSGYWHAAKRAAIFEKFPPLLILSPLWRPAFLAEERGNSPLMNVIWTVWVDDPDRRQSDNTQFRLLYRPINFPEIPSPTSEILMGRTGLLGKLQTALEENLASRLAA